MRVRGWLSVLAAFLLIGVAGCKATQNESPAQASKPAEAVQGDKVVASAPEAASGTAAAIPAVPSMPVTLVKDGQATSVIVIAAEPTESAQIGADELQYHIKKMSGAEIPIVTPDKAPADKALILIGASEKTAALNDEIAKLPEEASIIRVSGNELIIVGDDALHPGKRTADYHGTQDGVYDFLENTLGCTWLWPGVTGEYTPIRATIEVNDLNKICQPAMQRRHMRRVMSKGFPRGAKILGPDALKQLNEDEGLWYQRMRMGRGPSVVVPAGHSFTKWWNEYKNNGEPPVEVFALLQNGKREPSSAKKPDFIKIDCANPVLWKYQLEQFKTAHDRNPKKHDLSCCEDDGSAGFCTCDLCKAWDVTTDNLSPEQSAKLSDFDYQRLKVGRDGIPTCLSTRYALWYNEMAREVKSVDPQGYITAYAYTRYRQPPIGVKLEPNMVIGYIGLNGYPRTALMKAQEREEWLGWAQPGVKMYLRPNQPHYAGDGLPYNVARELADDYVFCLNHGCFGADVDSMVGYWAAWGPSYYVVPRLMWEGGQVDPEKIIGEWYAAFGLAERQVRAYYDYWEQYIAWVKTAPGGMAPKAVEDIYSPDVLAKAQELLDAAVAASSNLDEGVKTKIQNIQMMQRHTELTVNAVRLAKAYNGDKSDENKAALIAALKDLQAYRKEIAPRNVINVYRITDCELPGGDYWKGQKLPWDLLTDVTAPAGNEAGGPLID